MADDKRWMIRGVDREIRKAVKTAAKNEGAWVRRSLERALAVAAKGPAPSIDLHERVGVLEARISVLERSHRSLHQQVQVQATADEAARRKQKPWKPIGKSK